MKDFLKIFVIGTLVFFSSWFVVYKAGINKLYIQSEDELPAMFLPVTIIKEGTFYIDSYYYMLLEAYPSRDDLDYSKGLTPYYLRKVAPKPTLAPSSEKPHYISAFPVVAGLLAVPVYFLPLELGMEVTWENLAILSHLSGAMIVALSGYFFFLLLRKHFGVSERKSYLLTGVYLFGTINYALISQALWQHGPMQLFLIIGLHFLFNGLGDLDTDRSSQLFWSGLFLGLAILSRPTAALSWLVLYSLVYYSTKKDFKTLVSGSVYYLLGLVPVAAFFVWYNNTYYLNIANQGYSNQIGTSWLGKFPEGFLGVWFSPSKGILVYSPVIIFSIIGLIQVIKQKGWKADLRYLVFAAIVLLHTLVVGKWKHWYGGWSFGYRLSADVIPYMVLLMVPYINSDWFAKTKKWFLAAVVLSVLIEIYGIIFFDGIWHAAYDKGFENTSWLWSIKDSEFAFNIRRILVKLGLLKKACPQCLP